MDIKTRSTVTKAKTSKTKQGIKASSIPKAVAPRTTSLRGTATTSYSSQRRVSSKADITKKSSASTVARELRDSGVNLSVVHHNYLLTKSEFANKVTSLPLDLRMMIYDMLLETEGDTRTVQLRADSKQKDDRYSSREFSPTLSGVHQAILADILAVKGPYETLIIANYDPRRMRNFFEWARSFGRTKNVFEAVRTIRLRRVQLAAFSNRVHH